MWASILSWAWKIIGPVWKKSTYVGSAVLAGALVVLRMNYLRRKADALKSENKKLRTKEKIGEKHKRLTQEAKGRREDIENAQNADDFNRAHHRKPRVRKRKGR